MCVRGSDLERLTSSSSQVQPPFVDMLPWLLPSSGYSWDGDGRSEILYKLVVVVVKRNSVLLSCSISSEERLCIGAAAHFKHRICFRLFILFSICYFLSHRGNSNYGHRNSIGSS